MFCVAPASANTLAKLAHGLADNLLTSAALACTAPLVLAPAMNNRMWEHPATRANLERLRARGAHVVGPGTGALASKGEWGVGRLAEPAEILEAIEARSRWRGPLDGLRVLVTAGGTREPIDSVRYVGNRSSGRMGLALAAEAARRGAEVTLVAANVALPPPAGVATSPWRRPPSCSRPPLRAEFAAADVLVMAAAVGGLPPGRAPTTARSRRGPRRPRARARADRATSWPRWPPSGAADQTLIGFAAEHGEGDTERGRAKLERKGLDAVVVNDISRADIGFDADQNEVTIVPRPASGRSRGPRRRRSPAPSSTWSQELRTRAGGRSTVEGRP